ncbi:MAG: DUF445 family protein [Chitinophagaceae bacterium]
MNYWLLVIPFISAFIGWLINRVAVKLIFHPRGPKKFFGISFQGIFPKRQQRIAVKLGRRVSAEFLSSVNLEQKINDPKNLAQVMPLIEEHVDDFLRNKLKQQMPMLGMLIGEKTINTLKGVFLKEIENLFPLIMQKFASNLKNEFDLENMVVSKIAAFSSDGLEAMLSKEIRFVGIIGAIAGFLIGAVQVAITLLIF